MGLKTLTTAACLTLAFATGGVAAPIDFKFSYTSGQDTITGLIEGLDSDGAFQEATRITATGVLDSYIFENFSVNSFSVSNGVIDPSNFHLTTNYAPGIRDPYIYAVLEFTGNSVEKVFLDEENFNTAFFTGRGSRSITFSPVASVPLPATGLMLLSGIAGLVSVKRRKKRTP